VSLACKLCDVTGQQIGNLGQNEKRLLVRISYGGRVRRYLREELVDQLRHSKGMEGGSFDARFDVAKPANSHRVGK